MNYITDVGSDLNWMSRDCLNSWVLEFSHEKNDYFLNYRMMWKEVIGEIYRFNIGGNVVSIPSGFHMMIGDVYGSIDWISADEVVSRKVDVVILDKEHKVWTLKHPKFISVDTGSVYWPNTKNIIPMVSGENVLIVADKDLYTKTQEINIIDLLV